MSKSIDEIKDLLIDNGFTELDEDTLDELAEEISESIEGLEDEDEIAQTIYGNLVALGVDYTEIDDLMGTAENIASSL